MTHITRDNTVMELGDFLSLWFQHKKSLAIFLVVAAVFAVSYIVITDPVFEARTALISRIPSKPFGGRGFLKELSVSDALVGNAQVDPSTDNLINILMSEAVPREVVKELKLYQHYFPAVSYPVVGSEEFGLLLERGTRRLKADTKIHLTKEDLIVLRIRMKGSPELAATTANKYVEFLNVFLETNSFSEGRKKRVFIEAQIETTKARIADLNVSLLSFSPEAQTVVVNNRFLPVIERASRVTSELSGKKLELNFYKSYFSNHQNVFKQLTEEAEALEEKLKLADVPVGGGVGKGLSSAEGKTMLSFSKSPILTLQYYLMKQELNSLLDVLKLLNQQYELAKIEEAKEKDNFQIIDRANSYDIQVWPRPALILFFTILGVLFIHAVCVLAGFLPMVSGGLRKDRPGRAS